MTSIINLLQYKIKSKIFKIIKKLVQIKMNMTLNNSPKISP